MSALGIQERAFSLLGTEHPLFVKLLPTLMKADSKRGWQDSSTKQGGANLKTVLAKMLLPTLTASTYGTSNNGTRDGETPFNLRGKPSLDSLAGGPLNPQWCEWYMGFPIEHTMPSDVNPWETPLFRSVLRSPGT